jgi:hypothetical protein
MNPKTEKVLIITGIVFLILALGSSAGYFFWNKISQPQENNNLSSLNTDDLLSKLFPNIFFKEGFADLSSINDSPGNKLYLQKSIEDYFVSKQEKSLLLLTQLDGVSHMGGFYHAFLGVFDNNGKLLTPASVFPKLGGNNEFSGDKGTFGFYDCRGIKYILFISKRCLNYSCCNDGARLVKINNGLFENIQIIDEQTLSEKNNPLSSILPIANAASGPSYALNMLLLDDKILIKKVPPTSTDGCPETNYKELIWNTNTCKFE